MNPPRLIYVALLLYALGFALLFGAWMTISYVPPKENGPALALWITATLGALVGHILTILTGDWSGKSAPPDAPVVPASQSGFALPLLLIPIAIVAALMAGCTTTTASMYSGFATQAKAGIQVFDDNTLATMHDLLCAQPYSAIQRHPEMQPGIVALCGPLVNTASLDPAQVASMLTIAKQLGLVAAPAKAASSP